MTLTFKQEARILQILGASVNWHQSLVAKKGWSVFEDYNLTVSWILMTATQACQMTLHLPLHLHTHLVTIHSVAQEISDQFPPLTFTLKMAIQFFFLHDISSHTMSESLIVKGNGSSEITSATKKARGRHTDRVTPVHSLAATIMTLTGHKPGSSQQQITHIEKGPVLSTQPHTIHYLRI